MANKKEKAINDKAKYVILYQNNIPVLVDIYEINHIQFVQDVVIGKNGKKKPLYNIFFNDGTAWQTFGMDNLLEIYQKNKNKD